MRMIPLTMMLSATLGITIPHSTLAAAKKSAVYCKDTSGVEFVDTASMVTEPFLKKMESVGVRIVGRYYDTQNETLPGKRLRKKEVALLEKMRMSILVVFQHNNNKAETFKNWKTRGPADAEESLKLAAMFQQPIESAIYFGVDGDFVGKSARSSAFLNNEVISYFREIQRVFKERKANYKIGVYGSGATCEVLRDEGIISFCWLSHSHGFYGTPQALASKRFDIEQYLPGDCGGRSVDFGKFREGVSGVGEFPAKAVP